MAAPEAQILVPKVRDLFFDAQGNWIPSRYKVMYGGRGGLKSWGFARVAVMLAAKRRIRFLCCREFQNSIADSVHHTLRTQIDALGLEPYFTITDKSIESYTGAEFLFKGLHANTKSIKSTEGISIAWVEEASSASSTSLLDLTPTVFRNPGAEIFVSFNPDLETDPVSKMFIENPIPGARILQTNWRDNQWLPPAMHEEKDYLARVDPDMYNHVWEGGYRRNSKAQILANKYSIEAFEPVLGWNGPYYGADWGFSQDPTTLIKLWIHERKLYIEYEAYKIGCDIDKTPELFDTVPGARNAVIRADNARPETISYMQRHGYAGVIAADKWQGSVEDGIAHLRQYEQIIIHPRCQHTAQEARLYSYKVDKLTGDVLTDIVDAHNHCWDASRYALTPMMKRREAARSMNISHMQR